MTATLRVNPTRGADGEALLLLGEGFLPSTSVTCTYGGQAVTLLITTTDSYGNIATSFNAPVMAAGTHRIVLTDGTNSATAIFVSFPVQYNYLRLRANNTTYALCLVGNGRGNSTAQIPHVRRNGANYDIYLVPVANSYASPVRIKTTTGTLAVRYYTTHSDVFHTNVPAHSNAYHNNVPHVDVAAHNNSAHTNIPHVNTGHSDTPHTNRGTLPHTDNFNNTPHYNHPDHENTPYQDSPYTESHQEFSDVPHQDSHTDIPHQDDPAPHSDITTPFTDYMDLFGVPYPDETGGYPELHTNIPAGHTDGSGAHIDVAHTNSQAHHNVPHTDFADYPGGHPDDPFYWLIHTNQAHQNLDYVDVPHQNVPFIDTHTDHNDGIHTDRYGEEYVDVAAHDDAHQNIAHINNHTNSHTDEYSTHSDDHTDGHSDQTGTHQNYPHTDTHTNQSTFGNTPHSNTDHVDNTTIPTY